MCSQEKSTIILKKSTIYIYSISSWKVSVGCSIVVVEQSVTHSDQCNHLTIGKLTFHFKLIEVISSNNLFPERLDLQLHNGRAMKNIGKRTTVMAFENCI